jgi:predicted molibdopterin-dependent oxidoreductase YjgC
MGGRFVRLTETARAPVTISVDGEMVTALAGDTILTAILSHKGYLRPAEFEDGHRAGFCLMGSCQDCLVWTVDGDKLQACATEVTEGLAVVTVLPEAAWPPIA